MTPLKELGVSFYAIAIESQGNVNSGAAMRTPPFPKQLCSEAWCSAASFPDEQRFCKACEAAGTAPVVCRASIAAAGGGASSASGSRAVSASGLLRPAPGCLSQTQEADAHPTLWLCRATGQRGNGERFCGVGWRLLEAMEQACGNCVQAARC